MIPKDSVDFYPTPAELADRMVSSILTRTYGYAVFPGPILEPSAGDGAIAKAVERAAGIYRNQAGKIIQEYDLKRKREKYSLDCVELSEGLRAILKNDGFRVVHDDFLTFQPQTKYAAILMNPPFSAGAAHLLKALDIMQDGGKIRCVLNAETIRNPYTNERKDLAKRLQELGAEIEYIQDAFARAERKTGVEIALVSVDIPDRPPVSRIRLDLQQEATEKYEDDPQLAALVSADPITAAIERYNAAAEGLRRIYDEYNGVKSLFSSAVKDDKENPVIAFNKTYNEAIRDLRGLYWRKLFDLPQIRDSLTYKMSIEYSERIEDLKNYDFSAYNILTIREEISRNLVSGIEQEIISLFDDWTNLHYNSEYSKNVHYYNGWCTNEAYKVGKKVIFWCSGFDMWGDFNPHLYDCERKMSQIERVLHFLDTNGQQYNGQKLRDALKAAKDAGQTSKIQLEYFTATFYKKGTCHIEFTNTDVLKSFNLFASQKKGWLPPCYGKKAYKDMSEADKKVIDSYEGAASYADTIKRGLIPTTQRFLQLGA